MLSNGSRDPFGTNDKPVRRRTDEVKRMTGDEGQKFTTVGIEYGDIVWTHHSGRYNAVAILAPQRGERNHVVPLNIAQRPEECIAMGGDAHVAELPGQRGAGDMTRRAPESVLIFSFDDDHGEAEPGNFEPANQAANRDGKKASRGI